VRSTKWRREESGSAHGLVVARKAGNASGAKDPERRRFGAEGLTGTQSPEYQLLTNQTRYGANRDVDSVRAPSLELHARRAGSMKKCLRFQPDREIRPSGMIEEDVGNRLGRGLRHRRIPDEGPVTATPCCQPALRLHPTRPFDSWMKRKYPDIPFERYADDGVPRRHEKEVPMGP
jgi:hypothetical protein